MYERIKQECSGELMPTHNAGTLANGTYAKKRVWGRGGGVEMIEHFCLNVAF